MPELLDHRRGSRPRPERAGGRPAPRSAAAARGRRETLVFRLAMAAAALWVLDDAFWHREPGTAAGDHLASGLVPRRARGRCSRLPIRGCGPAPARSPRSRPVR